MYTFLINAGDRKFNDPISEYVPALANYASQSSGLTPLWDEITIGDLAGQMAGLSRDCETLKTSFVYFFRVLMLS
jgi:CubicO group peptidase (beta-lactamase class C family)